MSLYDEMKRAERDRRQKERRERTREREEARRARAQKLREDTIDAWKAVREVLNKNSLWRGQMFSNDKCRTVEIDHTTADMLEHHLSIVAIEQKYNVKIRTYRYSTSLTRTVYHHRYLLRIYPGRSSA